MRGYTVDGNKMPLSPDAFSGWCVPRTHSHTQHTVDSAWRFRDNPDPQKHLWREHVRQATNALLQKACQDFAAELDKGDLQFESVPKETFFEKLRITERAHRLGINCRHLVRTSF